MQLKLKRQAICAIGATFFIYATADASNPGFYTGVQLGQSKVDASANNLKILTMPVSINGYPAAGQGLATVKVDNDGFGGRAYGGYQFSQYLSAEGGYTQFANVKIANIYGISGLNDTLHQGALDGVAKLTLPLGDKAHVFVKGGAAYVFGQKVEDVGTTIKKQDIDGLRPTYGLGLNYDLTRRVSADITWSRIVGGGNVYNSDLTTLGLAYHFGQ